MEWMIRDRKSNISIVCSFLGIGNGWVRKKWIVYDEGLGIGPKGSRIKALFG